MDDVVSVLTSRVVPTDDPDIEEANELLRAAQAHMAHSPELMEIRDLAITQARGRLRIEQRWKQLRL